MPTLSMAELRARKRAIRDRPLTEKEQAQQAHPAYWAMCNRILNGDLWSFAGREYLQEIHESFAPGNDGHGRICVQKGAQTGFTESAVNIALYGLCRRASVDVLYVLPTLPDASAFAAGRIRRAIEDSPEIEKRLGKVRNAFHMIINRRSLYIRGSQSRSQLKSIPVAWLFLDEYDEMLPEYVALARERTSGHDLKCVREMNFSTPYLPGQGICVDYLNSDKRRWFALCPRCGKEAPLEWPISIDLDSVTWRCQLCRAAWSEEEKRAAVSAGRWVATEPGAALHGYHLPQFYSPVITARQLASKYRDSAESSAKRQEWYNSVLAEAHLEESARLSHDQICTCRSGTVMLTESDLACGMGIDVGSPLSYWVTAQWSHDGKMRIVACGSVENWQDLDRLMRAYSVAVCVIDAAPERHKTREFVKRHPGRAYMCYYPTIQDFCRWDHHEFVINANRTETLDRYLNRYRNRTIILPANIPDQFVQHHHAVVRMIRKSPQTNDYVARYEQTGADHYVHAANYCDLAGLLCGAASAIDVPEDPSLTAERVPAGGDPWDFVTVSEDRWGPWGD